MSMSRTGIPWDRRGLEALLSKRARTEPAFRRRLISDPKATIGQELGVEFPSTLKLRVLQETDQEMYLVLPAAGPLADFDARDPAAVVGGMAAEKRKGTEAETSGKVGTLFGGAGKSRDAGA